MAKKKETFKPFDKVLCRESKFTAWIPAFYGYYNSETNQHVMTSDKSYYDCILYTPNKDLYLTVEKTPKVKKTAQTVSESKEAIEDLKNMFSSFDFDDVSVKENKYFIKCNSNRFDEMISILKTYGGVFKNDINPSVIRYMVKATPGLKEEDFILYIDTKNRNIIKLINGVFQDGFEIKKTHQEIILSEY